MKQLMQGYFKYLSYISITKTGDRFNITLQIFMAIDFLAVTAVVVTNYMFPEPNPVIQLIPFVVLINIGYIISMGVITFTRYCQDTKQSKNYNVTASRK